MLITAVGNRLQSDDGVGWQVADVVRRDLPADVRVAYAADVLSLVELWRGEELAIVVDAVRSGAPAGTVYEIDATERLSPRISTSASTHEFQLTDAIELARILDCLPAKLIVVGIEGSRFDRGAALSPAVAAAVPRAAAILRRLISTGVQPSLTADDQLATRD